MDLALALKEAKPNDTLQLPGGRYTGSFTIDKPLTILARGQVVLDAQHAGPVLTVATDGLVRISGCTLVGGNAREAGGGIALLAGKLELSDSVVRFNKAPAYGGGGLFIAGSAQAQVTRCRFEANTGRQGGAILVDDEGVLRLEHSTLVQNAATDGGGLRVKEGAKVDVFACTLADNKVVGDQAVGGALSLAGTTTRAPTVTLSHCIVSERAKGPEVLHNWPRHPGTLAVTRSLLPEWSRGLGTDCVYAAAGFTLSGAEPYQLAETSPAVGAGDAAAFEASAKDVLGRPRLKGQKVDLGAFAFIRGGSSALPY
ncbi:MAG: choice-of-anchor Q domain-containing protein [Myxococcaceae bacterium]|nr:choice-of-anchor Q domain-containing protein [Myxococcaceae bacterium]